MKEHEQVTHYENKAEMNPFHDSFLYQVLRNFWRTFHKNRTYRSKVTQHYVIEGHLKIWEFSGCVQNIENSFLCQKSTEL